MASARERLRGFSERLVCNPVSRVVSSSRLGRAARRPAQTGARLGGASRPHPCGGQRDVRLGQAPRRQRELGRGRPRRPRALRQGRPTTRIGPLQARYPKTTLPEARALSFSKAGHSLYYECIVSFSTAVYNVHEREHSLCVCGQGRRNAAEHRQVYQPWHSIIYCTTLTPGGWMVSLQFRIASVVYAALGQLKQEV